MSQTRPVARRPSGAAFVIAALLAALGALLIWDGARIPNPAGYAGVGPGDMPRLVGGGLILLALWTAVEGARGSEGQAVGPQRIGPVLWVLAGLLLQLVVLRPLGFSIASGLLFACTAAAFGKRNLAVTLPIGFAFAFFVYAVFDKVLNLNLPAGPIETLLFGG